MICAISLLLAVALPQAPTKGADETKARAALGQAAQQVDELLLHAERVRERARSALDLARSGEAAAKQAGREKLASLAADLGTQLESLKDSIEAHSAAIRALRADVTPEIPPPAEGSVASLRDRMHLARKLPKLADALGALRAVERELQADDARTKPGADALLGHVRYSIAAAIQSEAMQAQSKQRSDEAVLLLRDASKKLDEVLKGADSSDTGEGSSLRAVALGRRVEVETRLYITYDEIAKRKPGDAFIAKRHRENAETAWSLLKSAYADATLPGGQRVVEATEDTVKRLVQSR
ncbi:MAG TPA: hypothetical protein VF384_15540 [Planctomycetota bacterium]